MCQRFSHHRTLSCCLHPHHHVRSCFLAPQAASHLGHSEATKSAMQAFHSICSPLSVKIYLPSMYTPQLPVQHQTLQQWFILHRLLLATEAPVVMPYSVDFACLVLHLSLGRMQHSRSRQP